MTKSSDATNVYKSQQFCLNVMYRLKGNNHTAYTTLHSSDDPKDDMIDVPVEVKQPPKE